MQPEEISRILSSGEDSRHQFKENILNADALAAELIAFSNAAGGQILVGVRDDGTVCGLSAEDVRRLNQLISNAASQNVRPAINPATENFQHPDGLIVIISVEQGLNRPYMDKNGAIWVKNGSDKRRATSREELQRLFQSSRLIQADELPVPMLTEADIDRSCFGEFLEKHYGLTLDELGMPFSKLLQNMNLMRPEGCLNLAGALLFAKAPQFALPAFIVKAVAFDGNDIAGSRYLDSKDIGGRLSKVFEEAKSFALSNTHAVQGGQGFNSLGIPEISPIAWEELLVNALIHRDYFVSAPIRLLIFSDRAEIISPGHLPNNLTVENILAGNSNMRNPVLASFATKILPYRGLGSGLRRALKACPGIRLEDDREGNCFRVTIPRPAKA